MDSSLADKIKVEALLRTQEALKWVKEDKALGNAVPEEVAAEMAAERIMYRLGMWEYAKFEAYIGNLDVRQWLLKEIGHGTRIHQ